MYSLTLLKDEIKTVIDRTLGSGQRVRAAWIATEVCNQHKDIDGDDKDFWQFTGVSGVHGEVRRFLSSVKSDEEDSSRQGDLPFTMPGYEYLQKMYFVSDPLNSEEGPVGTPLIEMNDEQIEAKAVEYEKMAAGCTNHANELRRYLKNRKAAA